MKLKMFVKLKNFKSINIRSSNSKKLGGIEVKNITSGLIGEGSNCIFGIVKSVPVWYKKEQKIEIEDEDI